MLFSIDYLEPGETDRARVGEFEGGSDRAVMFMHGKIMTIYQVDVDEKMELNLVWPHTELWRWCSGPE